MELKISTLAVVLFIIVELTSALPIDYVEKLSIKPDPARFGEGTWW